MEQGLQAILGHRLRGDQAGPAGGKGGAPGAQAVARLQQPEVTARPQSAQVNVSFSLSLELLSYQKLPADQMLPGVDIQQSPSGEKQMVFTQNLLLEYSNQTSQVSPQPGSRVKEGHRAELCSGGVSGGPTPIVWHVERWGHLHPYWPRELRARWGAGGCKIREGFLEEEAAREACTLFNGESRGPGQGSGLTMLTAAEGRLWGLSGTVCTR